MTSGWGGKGSDRTWRKLRARILDRDQHQCQIRLPGICIGHATHVDHILPKTKGGTDHPTNLRAACQPCNLTRGAGPTNPEPLPWTDW